MRIAICDDEVSMVQILEEKIKKLLPDAVIEKYLSGEKPGQNVCQSLAEEEKRIGIPHAERK